MHSLCQIKRAYAVTVWFSLLINWLAGLVLLWCTWLCLTMSENRFLELMGRLHDSGVAIAYFDGTCMLAIFMLLLRDLRRRCKPFGIKGGVIFFIPALAANMLDFFTTILQSPDLSLETNTVWISMKEVYGLQVALQFGFWGKIYLSVFAAACFTFYLSNVHVLFPKAFSGLLSFALMLGDRCIGVRQRARALATVLAFYFASINLFCFYIAYANSLVTDLPALSKLPALPAAIALSICAITAVFFLASYAAARRNATDKTSA